MIHEEDRSHTLPFQLPNDRPLTYAEQTHIWRGGAWGDARKVTDPLVPDTLRLGPVLEPRQFNSKAEFNEAVRLETAMEDHTGARHGWLLNRLEWDAHFPPRNRADYEVPDCCQPGAQRKSRKALMRLRNSMYPAPPFKKASTFEPPYDQAKSDGELGWSE